MPSLQPLRKAGVLAEVVVVKFYGFGTERSLREASREETDAHASLHLY